MNSLMEHYELGLCTLEQVIEVIEILQKYNFYKDFK